LFAPRLFDNIGSAPLEGRSQASKSKLQTYQVSPGGHAADALFRIALVVFPAGARKDPVCASYLFCIYLKTTMTKQKKTIIIYQKKKYVFPNTPT